MRIRKIILLVALAGSTLFWAACDSSNSMELPDYFVKFYGTEGDQEGVDMVANQDGSFYLFGNSTLPGQSGQSTQLCLLKVDSKGNMLWDKWIYFGGTDTVFKARDIELTSDGKLMLAATSTPKGGNSDVLLILTDLAGKELKRGRYGYSSTDEDVVSVTEITGGFVATGSTTNTSIKPNIVANDTRDILCLRFNSDLSIYDPLLWNQTLGPGTYDAGVKTIEVSPGLFYFFGYSNRPHDSSTGNMDFVVYQMNNNGTPKGADIFSGRPTQDERLTNVTKGTLDSGEGFLLSGIATNNSGINTLVTTKMATTLNSAIAGADLSQNIQFDTNPLTDLGTLNDKKTSSFPSNSSGYLVLSNDNKLGKEEFSLTKISSSSGVIVWSNPDHLTYGGANADKIGAVVELPDGKIVMIGTFEVGDDLQKKIALLKVNREGKFSD